MNTCARGIRLALLLVAWLPAASASDWYVDAALGSNANTGTSPAEAWQTITYAVGNTPQSGAQTIHVAPGTHDAALGEVFPWTWRPLLELVGDQGSASTFVVGSPGVPVILMESVFQTTIWSTGYARVQGFTLQGGTSAIEVVTNWNDVSPTLRDLVIVGASSAGVDISTLWIPGGNADSDAVLENLAVSSCGTGLELDSSGATTSEISVTDCSFEDSAGNGVVCGQFGGLAASFERCRIEGSGGWGLYCPSGNEGFVVVSLHATLIAHNQGGMRGTSAFVSSSRTTATQCTIADNGSEGVRMDSSGQGFARATLDSTIVHGHQDDLIGVSSTTVTYCDIGDGEFAGMAGNFQADPLFVDAPAGHYELLPGSPCIDAGNPALPIEMDCTIADVGAYPFVQSRWQAYCTSGTSASGCQALLSATGTPSASAASGFLLQASGVEGSKDGVFFWGKSGKQANPWGNGTSFQCVVPPVTRGGSLSGSGTIGTCDGSFAQDLNATWCSACPHPQKNPGAGAIVQAQLWYRDPDNTSNQTTSLSDALEISVCPR